MWVKCKLFVQEESSGVLRMAALVLIVYDTPCQLQAVLSALQAKKHKGTWMKWRGNETGFLFGLEKAGSVIGWVL